MWGQGEAGLGGGGVAWVWGALAFLASESDS